MMSFGNPATRGDMKRMGFKAGEPTLIGNLMAWCAGSLPGSDPECNGKTPGRVAWGPSIPAAMDTTETTTAAATTAWAGAATTAWEEAATAAATSTSPGALQ